MNGLLTTFPNFYEEELLYSTLARYKVRSGNISSKATIAELFGSTTVSAVVDLPSNIESLVRNMPIGSKHSSEEIIFKNTLYPFYTAFLPPERANSVLKSMKGNGGGGIHNQVGILASPITANRSLKFCYECNMENNRKYGEMYWHRIHQIPGVVICSKHKTLLHDSQVLVHQYNNHEFQASNEQNCIYNKGDTRDLVDIIRCADATSDGKDKAWNMALILEQEEYALKYNLFVSNVEQLLNNKFPNRPLDWFYNQYMNRLKEMGLANINGTIKQKELTNCFISYYGKKFLDIVQSAITQNTSNWLQSIVRKHRKAFHPIRHLLMMQFLGLTLENLFEEQQEYRPFGEKPWLCLNPGADHYLHPVVNDLGIRYDSKVKRPIGTFTCSCGFVYARKGPDTNKEDKYKVGFVKEFGPVWEKKLEQLLKMNLSLREMAKRLKADVNTIKKYAGKLEMGNTLKINKEIGIGERPEGKVVEDLSYGYKKEWLVLREQNPKKTKTELRRLNPGLYSWLYRNDKEWLNKNSPDSKQKKSINKRVNWKQRDKEILALVKEAIEEILNASEKPEQVTMNRVGKRIKKLTLLRLHLNKMPQTKSYLEEVIESTEDFQIRRIKWAIEKLKDEGEHLKWWKVVKKAGLREETAGTIKDSFKLAMEDIEFL